MWGNITPSFFRNVMFFRAGRRKDLDTVMEDMAARKSLFVILLSLPAYKAGIAGALPVTEAHQLFQQTHCRRKKIADFFEKPEMSV
jgi:hypothetical protein